MTYRFIAREAGTETHPDRDYIKVGTQSSPSSPTRKRTLSKPKSSRMQRTTCRTKERVDRLVEAREACVVTEVITR